MDESNTPMHRRSRRSNVLMAATIETSGESLPVKLRNLSSQGALVEADRLPIEGSPVVFRRGELAVTGHFAWVHGHRGGIAFDQELSPEDLLRHVPAPKPRSEPADSSLYRRPGLHSRPLTPGERRFSQNWLLTPGGDKVGD